MIRRGFTTNEVMVVIVTNGDKLPYKDEFVSMISENIPGIKSIIQNINSKPTNVILGLESKTLWGEDTISDYIGEFRFNISPLSFFQVNPMQTEVLYSKALEYAELTGEETVFDAYCGTGTITLFLSKKAKFFQVNPMQTEVLYSKALEYAELTGEETVFDAYCGTGTITLFLSKKAKKVYGVEIIPQAIDNAWINAKENNVDNVEFFVGESEVVIPDLINKGVKR